jgi:ATP phosphoribosyltransferase
VSADKPFVLAVPSKGRLQENAFSFFARAGLKLVQGGGSRDYRGRLAGIAEVEIAFLPVAEIVTSLGDGTAHLGVAGEDVLREAIPETDRSVAFLSKLGFGQADVVVAVPKAWIDVRTMADLEDVAASFHARRGRRMRVATKYVNLTRRFFADRGVTDYRIVESLGATEGAPAAGGAELIVDITTTGATLQANALKVLDDGVMLRSEANLAASLKADWSEAHRRVARTILGRIAAEERARTTRELRADFPDGAPLLELGALESFAATVVGGDDGRLLLHGPVARVADIADWLIGQGAAEVSVLPLDYVFAARNPLFEALSTRLG